MRLRSMDFMEGGELRDGPGLGWGFIDLAYVSSGCLRWLSSVFHTLTVYASSGRLILSIRTGIGGREMSWAVRRVCVRKAQTWMNLRV